MVPLRGMGGYAYDANGNLTYESPKGTFVYNAANEQISGNGNTFTWDADGNKIGSSSGLVYNYDAQNQLVDVDLPGIGSVGGNAVDTQLSYISADQSEPTNNGQHYDILGHVGDDGGTTYYTYTPGGQRLEETISGAFYNYLVDGLGSVIALTDSTGTIRNSYEYDPLGNSITPVTPPNNPVSNSYLHLSNLAIQNAAFTQEMLAQTQWCDNVDQTTLNAQQAQTCGNLLGWNRADPPGGISNREGTGEAEGNCGTSVINIADAGQPNPNLADISFFAYPSAGYFIAVISYAVQWTNWTTGKSGTLSNTFPWFGFSNNFGAAWNNVNVGEGLVSVELTKLNAFILRPNGEIWQCSSAYPTTAADIGGR